MQSPFRTKGAAHSTKSNVASTLNASQEGHVVSSAEDKKDTSATVAGVEASERAKLANVASEQNEAVKTGQQRPAMNKSEKGAARVFAAVESTAVGIVAGIAHLF
ncbi:hypothetical protein SVAN01_09643 [Stagonosporopsis vannaccii]|nr:hypothetical protein SVAN01_09643 [Stagonosporopsis vannaccii]